MNGEILLNDIAETLLILDKRTVDALYKTDDPIGCVGLYIFYYKTAKWQKTNRVKANDVYVKKCLKIGNDRLKNLKGMLKNEGLIQIVQNRKNGKITGWYVEVNYLVSQAKTDIKVDSHNNTSNQQVVNPTGSIQETNALKQYIKCLKKEIEVLKKGKAKKEKSPLEFLQFGEKVKLPKSAYEKLVSEFGELKIIETVEKINTWLTTSENGIKRGDYKNYSQAIRNWITRDEQPFDSNSSNEPSVTKIPTWKEKVEILSNGYKSSDWQGQAGEDNREWAGRVCSWLKFGLDKHWSIAKQDWIMDTPAQKKIVLNLHAKARAFRQGRVAA